MRNIANIFVIFKYFCSHRVLRAHQPAVRDRVGVLQPDLLPRDDGPRTQVSCDWWRARHVTSILISDWCPGSTCGWMTRARRASSPRRSTLTTSWLMCRRSVGVKYFSWCSVKYFFRLSMTRRCSRLNTGTSFPQTSKLFWRKCRSFCSTSWLTFTTHTSERWTLDKASHRFMIPHSALFADSITWSPRASQFYFCTHNRIQLFLPYSWG